MAIQIQRTVECNRCGAPASQAFGEGGRGWYESFKCPACGQAYEADGGPPTPEEFRRAIIDQEGEWTLEALAPLSALLLKAMREQFSLSLAEVQELKRRVPGEVRRGTRHEMEMLLGALARAAEPGVLVVRRAASP